MIVDRSNSKPVLESVQSRFVRLAAADMHQKKETLGRHFMRKKDTGHGARTRTDKGKRKVAAACERTLGVRGGREVGRTEDENAGDREKKSS